MLFDRGKNLPWGGEDPIYSSDYFHSLESLNIYVLNQSLLKKKKNYILKKNIDNILEIEKYKTMKTDLYYKSTR
jgi:hypothetical protein